MYLYYSDIGTLLFEFGIEYNTESQAWVLESTEIVAIFLYVNMKTKQNDSLIAGKSF